MIDYRNVIIGCLAFVLVACPKSGDGDKAAPAASTSVTVAPTTSGSALAAPPASTPAAGSAAAAGQVSAFSGTYSVSPGKMYIADHKDFANVKQAKDDPSKHVGEGTISLSIESDGRVTGTIDSGPASPAIIDGRLQGTDLRGNVRRKDPKDDGLTGTLDAKVDGDGVSGTLALAEATAAIVREGKLTLKKK